jgi:hypothetical protein
MLKWVVVYWITTITYNTVLAKQWDSRCQCYVEPEYKPTLRTDTARVSFKTKREAQKFIHNAANDFSGWRLDSAGVTIESLTPVPKDTTACPGIIYTTR